MPGRCYGSVTDFGGGGKKATKFRGDHENYYYDFCSRSPAVGQESGSGTRGEIQRLLPPQGHSHQEGRGDPVPQKGIQIGILLHQGSFYNMRHESYKSVHFNLALNFSSTSQTLVNQSYNILLGAMVNFRSCFILGQTWVTIGSVVIPRSWLDERTLEIPEKCQKVLLYDNLMSLTPLNFTMAKFQGKILLQSCLIAC